MESDFQKLNSIIPAYVHAVQSYQAGRPIEEVMKERNLSLDSISKLASNENPLGPSPKAIEEITKGLADLHRYPDMASRQLKGLLADRFDVHEENIVLGNGSEELIAHLIKLLVRPDDEIIASENTFIGFYISAKVMGANLKLTPMTSDYRFDVEAMIKAITPKTKLIYVANPNNPTGTYITKSEFQRLLSQVPADCVIAMDEAYIEYAQDDYHDYPNALEAIPHWPNVITLRTFSKAYGIAGMRVGYAIGHRELINHLHKVKCAFAPSSLAQRAAYGALLDDDYLERTVVTHRVQYKKTFEFLKHSGFNPIPSAANFICFPVGSEEAAHWLNEQLLNQGVIIRPLKAFGMPSHMRVSIGTEREMGHFVMAMETVLSDFKMKFLLQ